MTPASVRPNCVNALFLSSFVEKTLSGITLIMRFIQIIVILCLVACKNGRDSNISHEKNNLNQNYDNRTYEALKADLLKVKKGFKSAVISMPIKELNDSIVDFWVRSIGNDIYKKWEGTPWDFNGVTETPKVGNIACGYFVTTVLRDMGVKLNRVKLATCASLQMMKSICPTQKIQNLSYKSYDEFDDYIKVNGKGVYIIGLDFHTGFLVNDGYENWFIHSNYIKREGVTKETILNSVALKGSKTRWVVCLTKDKVFINNWLKDRESSS